MPNPKDYIDDEHVYVHSYVRKKHAVNEQFSDVLPDILPKQHQSKLIMASWIVHLFVVILLLMFTFIHTKNFDWRILSGFLFLLLSTLLVIRISTNWNDWLDAGLISTPLIAGSWIIHLIGIIAAVLCLVFFLDKLPFIWLLACIGTSFFLPPLLIIRIKNWWQDNS